MGRETAYQVDTELPCKLSWGRDPLIELWGTAVEIGPNKVLLVLAAADERLWPGIGRKVRVEVFMPESQSAPSKCLTCSCSIERASGLKNGRVLLTCSFRRAMFRDASNPAPLKELKAASGWKM